MGTEITWPDGLVSTVEAGPFSVSPAQVKALSKAGRAWFTATAKRAKAHAPRPVPQAGLPELARVYREAEREPGECQPRPDRYDAHVAAFRKVQSASEWTAVWERVKAAYRKPFSWEEEDRRLYLSWHEPEPIPLARNWFAFDEAGKVVLSLTCDRTRALEIAIAYNGAGGRLVLLAPEPVLADAATEDCIAIPDDAPVQGAVPVSTDGDPLLDFGGDAGVFYKTPHGRVAIERDDTGAPCRSHALVDPTITGEPTRATARPHQDDPPPDAVASWIEDVIGGAAAVTVYEGPVSKLKPRTVEFQKDPSVKGLFWTFAARDGAVREALFNREFVACVACKGAVRLEILDGGEDGAHVLRVHRRDGLVGVVAGIRTKGIRR